MLSFKAMKSSDYNDVGQLDVLYVYIITQIFDAHPTLNEASFLSIGQI